MQKLKVKAVLRAFFASIFLLSASTFASAQTSPNLTFGQVLTPAQWNQLFINKQDTLGFTPLNLSGGVMGGRLVTAPSSATTSGFNLTPGTAGASPANGDMWVTGTGIFAQVNGTTYGLSSTSPSYTPPYTGGTLESQSNYNAQRVSIIDFGAVPDNTTTHASVNAAAFSAALATGKVVFVPYAAAGYNIGANSISMTTGQVIECENTDTTIYSQIAHTFSITSNGGPDYTTILNCALNGQVGTSSTTSGSTAVYLNTSASNVNWVWLDSISCSYMTHCFDDANSSSFGTSYFHAKNIYTTETFGAQFRLRNTAAVGNSSNIDVGGLSCNFLTEPVATNTTWICADFRGFQGLKVSDQLLATGAGTGTPAFAANTPAFNFQGTGNGAVLNINANIYAENTIGDGISINGLYVSGGGSLYASQNLGAQIILNGSAQGNISNIFAYGPFGQTGAEASTDAVQMVGVSKINISNLLVTASTGGAINYAGTSSRVNITNLQAYNNQGYVVDLPSGGGNTEDYLTIISGQWDGSGSGGINNAISATHLCYLNITGISSSCFVDGLTVTGSATIDGTFTTSGNVVMSAGIGTAVGNDFLCWNSGSGAVTYSTWCGLSAINGVTIGQTTPAAGSFTSLSASGVVSGVGFTNYLASPPAIGGTAPNTGKFTNLTVGNGTPLGYEYTISNVNFNAGNVDTQFPITLPVGFTRYAVNNIRISGASTSLSAATVGVFTGAGATGTQIVSSGTVVTVNSTTDGTANNTQALVVNNSTVASYTATNFPTLYFRVQTPEGSVATGNVSMLLTPLP